MQNKKMIDILVVEDDLDMRELIQEVLEDRGYGVVTAANGQEALRTMELKEFPVIVSDLKMPVMGGEALLGKIAVRNCIRPFVILITAFGDIDEALRLIAGGAYDYIIKPFKMEQLLIAVNKAVGELAMRRRAPEDRPDKDHSRGEGHDHGLIGKSRVMRKLFDFIERIADSSGNVLLEGETGTGKEVIARAIHQASEKRLGAYVPVNCAAIPEGLLESELFGHVKGAFTDAACHKKGLFVEAAGGTLLLDEIAEMPIAIQAKILRVLQDKEVRAVGANRAVTISTRVIAATNKVLKEEVAASRFREDLYYRLNIFKIVVPPLRERREDIPLLVNEFLARHGRSGQIIVVEKEAMRFFLDYPWPGNIRELENVIERCVFLARDGRIALHDLPGDMLESCRDKEGLRFGSVRPLAELEIEYVRYVLARCDGNKKKAASLLGINRKTIHRKLEE